MPVKQPKIAVLYCNVKLSSIDRGPRSLLLLIRNCVGGPNYFWKEPTQFSTYTIMTIHLRVNFRRYEKLPLPIWPLCSNYIHS